jgi:hypothetical protein
LKLEGLVAGAADRLGASLEEDDGFFFLDVPVADARDEDDEDDDDDLELDEDPEESGGGDSQTVSVYLGSDGDTVYVRNSVAPYTESVDLAELLRDLSSAVFTRVYLEVNDEDVETIIVEACTPSEHLDEDGLVRLVQEVADRSEIIARELEIDDGGDDDED